MVQLHHRREDFEDLNTAILLISFSKHEWAVDWKEELGVSFPILLDPNFEAYRDYGLKSSFWGSWNPRILWYYVRQFISGRGIDSIKGNPNQMGGDFIIDAQGLLRYAHRSKDSLDRPPTSALTTILQGL